MLHKLNKKNGFSFIGYTIPFFGISYPIELLVKVQIPLDMVLVKEQIRLAFVQAQKEVDFLSMRTSEGMRKAMEIGHIPGHKVGSTYETKKAKLCKEIILKHSVSFGGSLADNDVITLCGCSRNSYYKYKSELSVV